LNAPIVHLAESVRAERTTGSARRLAARARRDRLLLGLVGVGVMALYLAVQRGTVDSWDGRAMASVAQNLLQHGSLKECCNAFGAYPRDPGPYAKFGIGYSLLLAPLWHFQLGSNPLGGIWLGLANPLLLTGATVVIAKTGFVLGWQRSSAVLSALAFGLLTMAPLYSAAFFAEAGVTFAASVVILGFALCGQRLANGALLIGVGTAVAILFRPDSVVLFGPIVPLLVCFHRREDLAAKWRTWLPRLGIPIALVFAWTLAYDALRYGSPFQLGYSGVYDTRGFSTPLLQGIGVLLWSPGKSFFVYSPILIAAVPGMIVLARRRAPLATVVVTIFVLRVIVYAKWWTPEGGSTWGPRFLLPLCAVLAIPFGEALEQLHAMRGHAKRVAVGLLAALAATSAVVQLSSLLVDYHALYKSLFDVQGIPASQQLAVLLARVHRTHWSLGGTQIVWNLRHVGSPGGPSPLYWFRHGATVFGVAMLVLAALTCASAIWLASLSDRVAEHRAPGPLAESVS
jgi:hypothetical protein